MAQLSLTGTLPAGPGLSLSRKSPSSILSLEQRGPELSRRGGEGEGILASVTNEPANELTLQMIDVNGVPVALLVNSG